MLGVIDRNEYLAVHHTSSVSVARCNSRNPTRALIAMFRSGYRQNWICKRVVGLSRNLFTSTGDNLGTSFVPNRNRIDGTAIARAQQPLAFDGVGIHEDRGAGIIEDKGFGRFGNAVAEPDAQRAVDAD